jgi:hypothetical protein
MENWEDFCKNHCNECYTKPGTEEVDYEKCKDIPCPVKIPNVVYRDSGYHDVMNIHMTI